MMKARKLLQSIALGDRSNFNELKEHLPKVHKGRNIHKTWTAYNTLHRASYEGWDDIVEVLLKCGVDPNEEPQQNVPEGDDFWGWNQTLECFSPLFHASRRGHLETVKLLLKAGAKVKLLNPKDFSGPLGPLEAAAEGGYTEIVEALLAHGEVQNKPQLNAALRTASNPNTVRVLLQAGADPLELDELGVGATQEYAYNALPECLTEVLKSNTQELVAAKTRSGMTALHAAAISGNGKCATILIETGADVEARDKQEATPLHYASIKSCGCDMISILVNRGCSVNARDRFGQTPLHWAVSANCEETVRRLVECGADVESEDSRGRKPRDVLPSDRTEVKEGFVEAVMSILNPDSTSSDTSTTVDQAEEGIQEKELHKPREPKTTSPAEIRKIAIWEMRKLYCHSYAHRKETDRKYVECNVPLLKDLLHKVPEVVHTYSGLRALFQVAHSKDAELMRTFLEAGANPNLRNTDKCEEDDCPELCRCKCFFNGGWSLLHEAANQDYVETVKVLLEYGASWDRISVEGKNHLWGPLEAAGEYARINSLQALLEVGAGTDIIQLNSALWHVCNPDITKDYFDHEFAKAIRLLLNAGADPNFLSLKTDYIGTSLHGAAAGNWPESITLLLRRGGDVSVRASNGWTPLIMSLHRWESFPVVEMWLKHGADVSYVDDKGQTVLHFAAGRYGNWQCIKPLVAAGANVNAKDKSGCTPLLEATKHRSKRKRMFSALLKAGANINDRDKQRRTVLHWAVKQNYYENVEYLVEAGADLLVSDSKGRTPFENVFLSDKYSGEFTFHIMKMLIEKGYFPALKAKLDAKSGKSVPVTK